MNIVLVNHAKNTQVTESVLERIASAVEEQLQIHYANLWQSAGVAFQAVTPDKVRDTDSPLVVFDSADQAGALGYHAVTPQGLPYGKIFVTPILENGGTVLSGPNSLSVTISHEALEMRGDPYANFWADMGDDAGTEDALELSDRTEADAYLIEGVAVSNFLGPRAFRDGPGPYDWMNLLKTPWEVRPGGYAIRRTGGPSGKYDNVWGEKYPDWKKELKLHPAARTARRMQGQR
jgi:hypothetical protein